MGIKEQLFKRTKKSAEKRGMEWDLSFEFWVSLIGDRCYYCGSRPRNKFKYGKRELVYSGVDRIDSGMGYTAENVVPCCRYCNSLKSSQKPETWFDFLRGVIVSHGGVVPDSWSAFQDKDRARKAPKFWNRVRKR